jgi:hypothetical protein
MCGPSDSQEQLAGQSSAFSQLMAGNYSQALGAQNADLQNLTRQYTPISEAGPNQGVGGAEYARMMTAADQNVGRDYSKASQSLNMTQSSRGGGNEFLPTGAAANQRTELAAAGANTLSAADMDVANRSQAIGENRWDTANKGLAQVAQMYDPNAAGKNALGAESGAFADATKIQDMKNQAQGGVFGAIAGVAKPFLSMIPGVRPAIAAGVGALGNAAQG